MSPPKVFGREYPCPVARIALSALSWPFQRSWASFAAANPTLVDPKAAVSAIALCLDEYAREYSQL